MYSCVLLLLCSISALYVDETAADGGKLPIVLWHGMGNFTPVNRHTTHNFAYDDDFGLVSGDTCCFSFSLGGFTKTLKHLLGNETYVKSIRIGNNMIEDYESGYFVHPNKQVEEACRQIASDEQLQNGYNAIGFSQGGQFLYVCNLRWKCKYCECFNWFVLLFLMLLQACRCPTLSISANA